MFRFELQIPFISVYTDLMYQHHEMKTKSYIAWRIQVWKWHWTLFWGKDMGGQPEKKAREGWLKSILSKARSLI